MAELLNQDPKFIEMISEHAHITAELARPQGVLRAIADIKLELDPALADSYEGKTLEARDIYEIILKRPEKGEPLSPRWQLVETLNQATNDQVKERSDDVLHAAELLGMKRTGDDEDYSDIDPEKSIVAIEGGANKTSVVCRGVADKMFTDLGHDGRLGVAYQFGSERIISPTRPDGSPNPEHKILKELAGERLPDSEFTEFYANLATALADGFRLIRPLFVSGDVREAKKGWVLRDKLAWRTFAVVQPTGPGLPGAFDALNGLQELNGDRQLVIATNGQYRSKAVLQAAAWAVANSLPMKRAVAIGDEPGDKWPFKGVELVTPPRPAAAYVNELALYGRQTTEFLVKAGTSS